MGCQECEFSGYQGRTVIAELVEINQEQRELLLGGENDIAKFKAAMRGTFNSMSMSASRLIISGITTAAEASRVIGHQFWFALVDEYGSELPDLSALSESGEQSKKERNAVAIAGDLDESSKQLQAALENSWLQVFTADGSEGCEAVLHENENVDLVVLELNESLSDDEIVASVADYRRHLAWARLPALIRLPASKQHWEALLREHGSTSRFVTRDVEADDIVEIIQQAISEKLDFRWGIQAGAD